MNNDEYTRYVWGLYEAEMRSRKNEDYEADPEQMKKLIAAYGFFAELTVTGHGHMEPLKLVPKECHGGLTAYFTVFYLHGDQLQKFLKIAQGFSAMSIDALDDGTVCLSFTIPNVCRRKQ